MFNKEETKSRKDFLKEEIERIENLREELKLSGGCWTDSNLRINLVKAQSELKGILETEIKYIDIIDEYPDPYPTDIFPEISPFQLIEINKILQKQFKFPLDRLSAHIGRLLLKGIKENLKSKFKEK